MKFYESLEYVAHKDQIKLFKVLEDGDQNALRCKEYLIPYQLEISAGEGGKAYSQRASRTYYTNFFKALRNITVAYMFREGLDLSEFVGDDKLFTEEEAKNIDGHKTSLTAFLRKICNNVVVYPYTYVLVDAPAAPEGRELSEQQAREVGLRPYGHIWHPIEVKDWLREDGNPARLNSLNAIQREYDRIKPRESLSEEPTHQITRDQYAIEGGRVVRRRYSRASKNAEWKQDGAPQVFDSRFSEIPMVACAQEPYLKDAADEALHLYNLESSKENVGHFQAYQRIFIAGEPLDTSESQPAAENTIIWLKAGSDVVVVPEASGALLKEMVDSAKNNLFRLGLKQLRQLDASSKQVQSAETQHADNKDRYDQVRTRADDCEDAINDFLSIWAQYKNREVPERLKLAKKYDDQALEDFLTSYESGKDLYSDVPSFGRAMAHRLVKFQDFSEEEMSEISEEIDTLEFQSPGAALGGAQQARSEFLGLSEDGELDDGEDL